MRTLANFVVEALREVLSQREKTTVPYPAHPLHVCRMVLECEGTQSAACAAVLHESVEQGRLKLDEVTQTYGKEVAQLLVSMLSPETPRKREALLLQCADKVDQAIRWYEAGLPRPDLSRLILLIRKLDLPARNHLMSRLEPYLVAPLDRPALTPQRTRPRTTARGRSFWRSQRG